ncbi:MAG: DUF2293 domain-containing protein [Patescibacteria group bacterium]|nr:DUF2293 domain-containing protein [Patescibacteria group bacterium]MDE1971499.1 DUF2293 domain-containing protein [Patescibacteria group bacterium]
MQKFNAKKFREIVDEKFPYIPEDAEKMIINREATRPNAAALSVESYGMLALAAVAGYIRHKKTNYDALLGMNLTRDQAKNRVRVQVMEIERRWGLQECF